MGDVNTTMVASPADNSRVCKPLQPVTYTTDLLTVVTGRAGSAPPPGGGSSPGRGKTTGWSASNDLVLCGPLLSQSICVVRRCLTLTDTKPQFSHYCSTVLPARHSAHRPRRLVPEPSDRQKYIICVPRLHCVSTAERSSVT